MPLPRADKREFRVWTPEEAQRFTSLCREDPAGLVFLVALTTGLGVAAMVKAFATVSRLSARLSTSSTLAAEPS